VSGLECVCKIKELHEMEKHIKKYEHAVKYSVIISTVFALS
jgi:hypothetical protein